MSGGSSVGQPTGFGDGPVAVADTYFQPREPAWFRGRLTLRLAVPMDPAARLTAWRVAAAAALVSPPIVVLLIAPAGRLTLSTLLGLVCVGLPGIAALSWSAAALREERRLVARGLRQAGAEHRSAGLIASGRLMLFTAAGAICGVVVVAVLHAPLGALLPQRAPLHGMFGAGAVTWIVALVQTTALTVAVALAAGSATWRHVPRRNWRLTRTASEVSRP